MTHWLTDHFSLEEFTATQQRSLDNTPTGSPRTNLEATAHHMETVRALLGDNVIRVNSGYRSPAVNKAVGGAKTSAHLQGYAVDFTCQRYGSPLDICRALEASQIQFDQVIEEGTWVHISFDPRNRRQVLTMKNGAYTSGLAA